MRELILITDIANAVRLLSRGYKRDHFYRLWQLRPHRIRNGRNDLSDGIGLGRCETHKDLVELMLPQQLDILSRIIIVTRIGLR